MLQRYLKEKDGRIRIVLGDPTGSSLLHKVKYNVCYAPQQSERKIRKHRYDSIVEGVGLDRITNNFKLATIDDGYLISDQEILEMAHWLLKNEGLFVGSSSALNVAAAVRECWKLKSEGLLKCASKIRVVTVICDSGFRHISRFWNEQFATQNYGLHWPRDGTVPECIRLHLS